LQTANWRIPDEDDQDKFLQKILAIFKAAEELRMTIYEQIISADISLLITSLDQPFVPMFMEDANQDDGSVYDGKDEEIVLATVGLGLKRASTTKEILLDGTVVKSHCVLPPKVFLVSALETLFSPLPLVKGMSTLTLPENDATHVETQPGENEGADWSLGHSWKINLPGTGITSVQDGTTAKEKKR